MSAPGTPTGLTAVAANLTGATLSWTADGTGGTPTSYIIYETSANTNNVATQIWETIDASTAITLAGRSPDGAYQFSVAAKNADGVSAASTDVSLTMPIGTAPGAPLFLSAAATSTNSGFVGWTQPDGNWVQSEASSYHVFMSTSPTGPFGEVTEAGVSSGVALTDLAPNTTYYVQVSAFNQFGNSDQAAVTVNFTTPVVSATTIQAQVTQIEAAISQLNTAVELVNTNLGLI